MLLNTPCSWWRGDGCAACGPSAAVGFEMENRGGVLPSAMYLPR